MLLQLPALSQDIPSNLPAIIIQKPVYDEKPKEVLYTIKSGDNLTKIAEAHTTTVARLWAKNTELTNPDLIEAGKPLKIPQDEVLADREMPVVKSTILETTISSIPHYTSSSGNLYSFGFCTYFVKEMRPDLPNNLGNANTWFTNAANQGLSVGYTPKIGAVAVAIGYTHVALVTAVHDTTITVQEMNFKGWNIISTRVAPISEFRYIY